MATITCFITLTGCMHIQWFPVGLGSEIWFQVGTKSKPGTHKKYLLLVLLVGSWTHL